MQPRAKLLIMNQTKLESAVEVFFNYGSGFVIALATYAYIVLPSTWLKTSPFWVTVLFTFISVFRSFLWRRFFNAGLHKATHKIVTKYLRRKK